MSTENARKRLALLRAAFGNKETKKRIETVAAVAALAEYKDRIFSEGRASDGSDIGKYSTSPFYQNPNKLIGVGRSGVKPRGKNGRARFNNGRLKKTAYLAQGYKELRDKVGRQSQKVDLNFSGSTAGSIQVGVSRGETVFGFTTIEGRDIMKKNETRFNKEIVRPSQGESEAGLEAAQKEILQIFNELNR